MEKQVSAIDRQKDIYLSGFAGKRSSIKISMQSLESEARQRMSDKAYAYIAGGAGNETTMSGNQAAFEKWKIVPRMLRDVSERDTSIELFGQKISSWVALYFFKSSIEADGGMFIGNGR